jgi:uncharacterized alkaline shock family protein YloU
MSENKEQYRDRAPGATTIAPGVLVTIAQLTALNVDGVASMAATPSGMNRILRRDIGEGVRIEIEENSVSVELYLILNSGVNVRDVCRKVQVEVSDAIEQMVGMDVERIDIHVQDIHYDQSTIPDQQ